MVILYCKTNEFIYLVYTWLYYTVRQMYLFIWYIRDIHGTEALDFYSILSTENPGIVQIVSIYIYQLMWRSLMSLLPHRYYFYFLSFIYFLLENTIHLLSILFSFFFVLYCLNF